MVLTIVLLPLALGCDAFDERWTEFLLTADPEVMYPVARSLSYCVWDDERAVDRASDGTSTAGLRVRSACEEGGTEYEQGTAPLPGTIVVERGSGEASTARVFFQLRLATGPGRCATPDACPCWDGCPPRPSDTPGVCLATDPASPPTADIGGLDEPPRYAIHFTTLGTISPVPLDGDAGSLTAGCP